MYKKAFYLLATLVLSFSGTSFLLAVSRGSGSYTSRLRLYSPAQYEDSGWGTDASTNSIRINNSILETRISNLDLLGDNTNYVNLTGSTQTKSGGFNVSGSIGVGASASSSKLLVQGAADITQFVGNVAGLMTVSLKNLHGAGIASVVLKNQDDLDRARFYFDNQTSGTVVETMAANPLLLHTNNLERVRIDSSGRVGIGDSPTSLLDVEGGSVTVRGAGSGLSVLDGDTRLSSASITTVGLIPNFSIACPASYSRIGMNECISTDGTQEVVIASVTATIGSGVFFTTGTSSLTNARAKAVTIRGECSFTNNSGVNSGIFLSVNSVGNNAASTDGGPCYSRTVVTGEASETAGSKTVLLDSNYQFNYNCQADNSVGSANSCLLIIDKIFQ